MFVVRFYNIKFISQDTKKIERCRLQKKKLLRKSHSKFIQNPEKLFPIRLDKVYLNIHQT